MSYKTYKFIKNCTKSDTLRDQGLVEPVDITAVKNISYADVGNQETVPEDSDTVTDIYNLLDVYFPKNSTEKLPVIISIHGGGYVYGTKEIYKYYGMYLAGLGFCVVNFNYHLAPKAKFPTPLKETNQVIEWCIAHAEEYHMDMNNTFLVGDSAGAQICSQYAAIYSNPEYAKLFPFRIPKGFVVRAIGLNCGMYDFSRTKERKGFIDDYLGWRRKDREKFGPMLDVLGHITGTYPPTYLMTAVHDFLRDQAEPMCNFLMEKGVEARWRCYGEEDQEYMSHVCHVNMNLEEARQINIDETDFFRKYMK